MKYLGKMKTAAVTAAVILISFAFLYFGTAGFLDIGVSDWLNQRESVTNKKIYIIGIDDKTLEKYGPVNTWSREIPAPQAKWGASPLIWPAALALSRMAASASTTILNRNKEKGSPCLTPQRVGK